MFLINFHYLQWYQYIILFIINIAYIQEKDRTEKYK
jgi:hypothetical protein